MTSINILLDFIKKGLKLTIGAKKPNTMFEIENAEQEGEFRFQLKKGCF